MKEQSSPPEAAAPKVRGITYAELVTLHSETKNQVSQVAARWSLGLAVGNGGGLVALSSQIITNIEKPISYMLFPSAWMFAIGLCVIGVAPGLANWRATLGADDLARTRQNVWDGKPAFLATAKPKTVRNLYLVETAAEVLSGALFAAGLIYPLAVLSHRYFCTGSFS